MFRSILAGKPNVGAMPDLYALHPSLSDIQRDRTSDLELLQVEETRNCIVHPVYFSSSPRVGDIIR